MAIRQPLHLRIFISSPGDVAEERALARTIVRALPTELLLTDRVYIQPVMWDDPDSRTPMIATQTPQESVNDFKGLPSECDLTVVILWSRLGSPPVGLLRKDGTPFESGTVWEYEDARAAERDILVFRRTAIPESSIEDDDEALGRKRAAYAAVKRFFDQFGSAQTGPSGGVNPYATPSEFETLFRNHIGLWLRKRLDDAALDRIAGSAPSQAKPYLVPRPDRSHPIVGRAEIVEELWQLILDGRSASLHFLPGVGKTTLAMELVRDQARVLAHFEGVLWANLGTKPDYTLVYQTWAEALNIPRDQRDSCASDADWKRALRAAIGARKLLVVLDDVWQEDAARTFIELVPQGVFVLTTRARNTAFADVVDERAVKREVPELTPAAARTLLEALAAEAVRAHSRETDTLVKAVNGIPLALLLAGKYLSKASADGDRNRLRKAFEKMLEASERFKLAARQPNGEYQSFKEIIEESYAILPSKNAQRAFLALSIFRPKPNHFTEDMAREVCGIDDETIYELNDMGLLEHYGASGASGVYTMHRVITQFARDKLNPADSVALHRRAVAYFDSKLKEQAGPDRGEYRSWYRYEQADWQTLMDAWLYHLSHAGDEDGAMVAFVRRYFDAFWWWGYYQRFQFSEQMIDEWSPRRLREDFREALEHIQRFANSYPEGYEKRGQGNWGEVVDAICQLRRILKLEDGGANLSRYNGRRVRAFTEFLLAEATAYGEADPAADTRDKALATYALAYDRFIDLGEPWVAAWIRFYEADVRFDWGDMVGADLRAKQALEQATQDRLAKAERDPELLANLFRLQGDIALAQSQMEIAFAYYAAASFHAWIFQAVPQDADSYTMAFYQEVTETRIAQQLVRLASAQRAQAEKLLLRLGEFWAPARDGGPVSAGVAGELLNRASATEIAATLFPAPLPESQLRTGAADFAARVRELSPQVEAKLLALGIYR